ncbi:hypothetical protein OPV22_026648 [Ensete ventricosum]|uniref:DYW domain-containing protein n=1 Tax=Ensete ventricosum TaxID=4639 RepID=A0AAV8P952_ENSVE|nr:hypothetical protein OPV22_026648 [Ensete ventricosum]
MPIKPDSSVWGTLLRACRNCRNLELGDEVARRLFEIEPDNAGNFVLLSNMYASHGQLEEAKEVRRTMESTGLRKETGLHKEQSMWYHSERLALSFGLITLPVNAPIRIKKNLRTCRDCHTVMKLVSEIFQRKIIVRNANRFHQFVDGFGSCMDYW